MATDIRCKVFTVRQLIKELKTLEPDRIVVMSKDSEGNSYSPLAQIDVCAYKAESTWEGTIGSEELTEEMKKAGYTEEDVIKDGVKAICLWPTN